MTQTPTPTRVDRHKEHKATISARLNDHVRNTGDLSYVKGGCVVTVLDDFELPSPPAPAWYVPKTNDAFVHLDMAKVSAEGVAEGDAKQNAVVMGLLVHELAHSKLSDWLFSPAAEGLDSAVFQVCEMFEEIRIERFAVNHSIGNRARLRAALPLAIGTEEDDKPTDRFSAARTWALGYGRVLSSVIEADAIRWLDNACRTALGDDDVDIMRDILQDAIEVRDPNMPRSFERMVRLAKEWLDVVGWPPKVTVVGLTCAHGKDGSKGERKESDKGSGKGDKPGEGEGKEGEGGAKAKPGDEAGKEEGGKGSGQPGEGDPDDTESEETSAGVADSISQDIELLDRSGTKSMAITDEDAEVIMKEMAKVIEETSKEYDKAQPLKMADPHDAAEKVFGAKAKKDEVEEYAPPIQVSREVGRCARALEALAIPAISKVQVPGRLPPGRLRTREAVRASAERSQGKISTAQPWETTRRTHARVRPIVVGVATDISGSMRWAQKVVANFAFVWTNAGQRIGARTAAVTFGDSVNCIARPGEVMSTIRERTANGGTERADMALAALDGVLHLTRADGAAKVLMVVSDGHLVIAGETHRVTARLEAMKRAGTAVLWVSNTESSLTAYLQKSGLATVMIVSDRAGEKQTPFEAVQAAALKAVSTMAKVGK